MTKIKILIHLLTDISDLVKCMNTSACDIRIKSGKYVVDAKSIMGVFSLDLSRPIIIESDSILEDSIMNFLNKFKYEE